MDDLAAYNQQKWDELARRGVEFGRPLLDLTPETARGFLDPHGVLGELRGKDVLCLAGAGGQQSAAFAVLGARVRVLDLSGEMLRRDRLAAERLGLDVSIEQGDMRDLSRYPDRSFDLVWQPYSINFVPDPALVFAGVARVLRPGGGYHLQFHNPYVISLTEYDWDGAGYALRERYLEGAEMTDQPWEFEDERGEMVKTPGPRAFRHTLGRVINTLAGLGFALHGLWEEGVYEGEAAPGTYEHLTQVAPPWLTCWFRYW